jgi:hypothetical protein
VVGARCASEKSPSQNCVRAGVGGPVGRARRRPDVRRGDRVGGEVGPGPVAAAIACGQAGVQQGDSGGQVAGAGHRAGAAVHQPWFDQAEPVGSPEEMDP